MLRSKFSVYLVLGLCLVSARGQAGPDPFGPIRDVTELRAGLASIVLTDQMGNPFSLDELQGNVVLLNFIFTHCATACPLQTQRLKHLKRQIDAEYPDVDLRLVSVSLTPEQDTPKVLAHYANAQGISADGTWRLLTGDTLDVNKMMALLGMKASLNDADILDHLTNLYLFDRTGLLKKQYNGMSDPGGSLSGEVVALSRVGH